MLEHHVELEEMLSADIIEPSISPLASVFIMVNKKNNKVIRKDS